MAKRTIKRFHLHDLFDTLDQFMEMTTIEKVWSWGWHTYLECWEANPIVEWICISE